MWQHVTEDQVHLTVLIIQCSFCSKTVQATEKTIISTVHTVFGDNIISMTLWPLHSSDVSPCSFLLVWHIQV